VKKKAEKERTASEFAEVMDAKKKTTDNSVMSMKGFQYSPLQQRKSSGSNAISHPYKGEDDHLALKEPKEETSYSRPKTKKSSISRPKNAGDEHTVLKVHKMEVKEKSSDSKWSGSDAISRPKKVGDEHMVPKECKKELSIHRPKKVGDKHNMISKEHKNEVREKSSDSKNLQQLVALEEVFADEIESSGLQKEILLLEKHVLPRSHMSLKDAEKKLRMFPDDKAETTKATIKDFLPEVIVLPHSLVPHQSSKTADSKPSLRKSTGNIEDMCLKKSTMRKYKRSMTVSSKPSSLEQKYLRESRTLSESSLRFLGEKIEKKLILEKERLMLEKLSRERSK